MIEKLLLDINIKSKEINHIMNIFGILKVPEYIFKVKKLNAFTVFKLGQLDKRVEHAVLRLDKVVNTIRKEIVVLDTNKHTIMYDDKIKIELSYYKNKLWTLKIYCDDYTIVISNDINVYLTITKEYRDYRFEIEYLINEEECLLSKYRILDGISETAFTVNGADTNVILRHPDKFLSVITENNIFYIEGADKTIGAQYNITDEAGFIDSNFQTGLKQLILKQSGSSLPEISTSVFSGKYNKETVLLRKKPYNKLTSKQQETIDSYIEFLLSGAKNFRRYVRIITAKMNTDTGGFNIDTDAKVINDWFRVNPMLDISSLSEKISKNF